MRAGPTRAGAGSNDAPVHAPFRTELNPSQRDNAAISTGAKLASAQFFALADRDPFKVGMLDQPLNLPLRTA